MKQNGKCVSHTAWQQMLMYAYVFKHTLRCSSTFLPKKKQSSRANESQRHEYLGWGRRLLAFHWALASHVVRGAVVHLRFPPWLGEGVHCGREGQWRAMMRLYVHLKVGRSWETWDQENREQGSCLTCSWPSMWEGRPRNTHESQPTPSPRAYECISQNVWTRATECVGILLSLSTVTTTAHCCWLDLPLYFTIKKGNATTSSNNVIRTLFCCMIHIHTQASLQRGQRTGRSDLQHQTILMDFMLEFSQLEFLVNGTELCQSACETRADVRHFLL